MDGGPHPGDFHGRPRARGRAGSGAGAPRPLGAAADRVLPAPTGGGHDAHRRGGADRAHRPRGPVPALRRALHHAPGGGGDDRGRAGPRRPDRGGRAPARRGGGHGADARDDRADVRRGGGAGRRRRDQARPPPVQLEGGPAGRHHPQDARRHGGRLAGPADQAGRPAAQHAHAGRDAGVEAAPHGPGDLRRLRAVGPPPRRATGAVAARGPRLRHAAPQALCRDRADGGGPGAPARGVPRAGPRPCAPAPRRDGHRRRRHRPPEAPVVDLREDGGAGQGVRRHQRPGRHPRRRRLREGLLGGARRHPRHLGPGARALQGLHQHAQVQHVPVAAHDGHRARRQAGRGADPHLRDAPPGRVRHRGALGLQVQGGPFLGDGVAPAHRRRGPPDGRPDRVPRGPQARPRAGRGLRLHAQGQGHRAPGPLDAGRLRLRHPHRGRAPLHRRPGERPARAARDAADVRRHRGDLHVQVAHRRSVSGLAPDHRLHPRPQQDPTVVLP